LSDCIFKLDNITFAYPMNEPVLSDFSLSIGKGQRVCILGANGCGKSTLLKIFAGLLLQQSGDFYAFGSKADLAAFKKEDLKLYHRKVGYIFQDSDVQLFCSNVREELAFGPLQMGMGAEESLAKVDAIAKELDIEKLLDNPPYHLSGGEKKKVAIASVLITDPEVIILDEPTNDLDPRSQTWLLKLLRSLGDEGKTLIFATHNLELVPHVADRAILFGEDHRIHADLPVREMLSDVSLLQSVNLVDEHFHTHPWDFE